MSPINLIPSLIMVLCLSLGASATFAQEEPAEVTTRGNRGPFFYSATVDTNMNKNAGLVVHHRPVPYDIGTGKNGKTDYFGLAKISGGEDGLFIRKFDHKWLKPRGGVWFTDHGCAQYDTANERCAKWDYERLVMSVGSWDDPHSSDPGNGRPSVFIRNGDKGEGRGSQGLIVASEGVWSTTHFENVSGNDVLYVAKKSGGGRFINAYDRTTGKDVFTVKGDGTTQVRVLEVLGGADLAEGFDVKEALDTELAPGTVLSIDPEHAGQLVESETAYDRRVAGVVSGAGGVNPGMLLGQEGTEAHGATPVALTGRVYVRCDTSAGPIQPGDLLTTSERAGHCMKVSDHAQALGAILGKAMGSLEEETGLVLALVGLQ